MQSLESKGFISKLNISSGRIPTNRAIKFYLKELISNLDRYKINTNLPEINDFDFNSISDNFLSSLSSDSHNIGFIFLNSIFDLNFKKVNLIKVAPHRIMIIIQSLNDWTFSKIFTTIKNYPEVDLKNWEYILNKEFRGKTLKNTIKIIRNRLFKEKEKYIKIYKELYSLFENKDLITAELFYKGELNILDSDLIDPSRVKRVIETLEDKVKLSNFLNDILHNIKKMPVIMFGNETGISELEDLILIFSNFYYSNNPLGNIGVIGPKFMYYPNTISQIELFSSYFSKNLSKNLMEV